MISRFRFSTKITSKISSSVNTGERKKMFTQTVKNTEAVESNIKVAASPRQLCDLELIANGGFAELNGFLNR